jgi:hypothetical protein
MTRKPKTPAITDIKAVQRWEIRKDENGLEGYIMAGWHLQIQRGTDEWEKVDVENVIAEESFLETKEQNN